MLGRRLAQCAYDVIDGLFDDFSVVAFGHDADDGFGAGGEYKTQQTGIIRGDINVCLWFILPFPMLPLASGKFVHRYVI